MKVVVLEDSEDLRFLMQMLLKTTFGVDALCVGSFGDFVAREADVLQAGLVMLDVNLGEDQPSGIDAYEWLRRHAFSGRICFLTGHARHHPLAQRASQLGARILEKPLAVADLRAILADPQPAFGVPARGGRW
jgi:FixJ family two-component response regulator